MFIFGGFSNELMNDLWRFDFTNMEWTLIETKNNIVSPRYGHTCVLFKNELFVFGGCDKNGSSNNLFSLNLETWEWKELTLVPSEGDPQEISGRYFHSSVVDESTGNMFIFGGRSAKALTNDFIKVNLGKISSENLEVQYEYISKLLPINISRYGQSSFLDENGIMYCLGGTNDIDDCLDCISCDLKSDNPSWKPTHNFALSDLFSTLKDRTNNVSKEEALPVFHSLTPFKIGESTSYLVFGGKVHCVENASEEATKQPSNLTEKTEHDGDLSLTDLNDDVYHLILSLLDIKSLNSLVLVSKKLRIGQLTLDDRYWADYFKQKVHEFKEGSKKYRYEYETKQGFFDYDESLAKYENINSEFKSSLIDMVSQCITAANKDYLMRTANVEATDLNTFNTPFLTKEELLIVDVSEIQEMSLKVVLVGDGAVGKYQFFK